MVLQIQSAHFARRLPGAAVRAPVFWGARIPRLRLGFRQRARTPAVRLNLGEGNLYASTSPETHNGGMLLHFQSSRFEASPGFTDLNLPPRGVEIIEFPDTGPVSAIHPARSGHSISLKNSVTLNSKSPLVL
jgi:hypothetical protein